MTANQNRGTRHQSAAEHPVKFLHAGAESGDFIEIDLIQALDAGLSGRAGVTTQCGIPCRGFGRCDDKFLQGIPGTAAGALPLPF